MNVQDAMRKLQDAQALILATVPEREGRPILDLIEDAALIVAEDPFAPGEAREDVRDLFVWGCGTAEVYGKPD